MSNKLGIYYAFWEQEWAADFLKYVEKVSRLGFDVLEINAGAILDMSTAQRKDLSNAARDVGIELTYCIGLPRQYDMASEDSAVRQAGIDYVQRIVKAMYEMGGRTLGGILYGCWPCLPAQSITDKSKWWDVSVSSVRQAAKSAEDAGVTLCMEVVNRFEQFLLNTVSEGIRFVNQIGSPNVKLLLDAFHMNIEEDSLSEAIQIAQGYIGHFHIGETNRRVPGRGRMPWDELLDALKAARYEGAIVMEPFLRMGGQVGSDIRVWRDLSNRGGEAFMDQEAAFALNFIRSKLNERG